tara:strand:+ start:162 stop:938 length:777 start_codon:yes stop_codon:yes gene_type:complete
LKVRDVIVGSCFDSILKSYTENKKIILTRFDPPHYVDVFDKKYIIEKQFFHRVSDAWSFIKFMISMRGLVINPESPFSVRVQGDRVYFDRHEVHFHRCHLFTDQKVKVDLEVSSIENENMYRVLDIMKLHFCSVEDMNMTSIRIEDSYIDEVRFFGKKEIICISYLDREQLNSFDYSDTMTRFHVEKALLSEGGLRRPLISPTRGPRKPKPYVTERIVEPLKQTIYKSTKRIKYYGRENSFDIVKTRSGYNTSIRTMH